MDYEGKSLLETQADPQTAINTADILLLKSDIEKLENFYRVEGITLLPDSLSSNVVAQLSQFSGLRGDFYKNGYVQTNTLNMIHDNVETKNLYRLRNSETGAAVIGIQWKRRASDDGTVRFRITGFVLFSSHTMS